jgi:pyridoxamine 5'-phosphate oxidase
MESMDKRMVDSQIHGPVPLLNEWLSAAREAGELLPEAMALATTRPDGSPSVRMVMLRELGSAPVFFTDCESDKGVDLARDGRVAMVLHWQRPIHRQVRITGSVTRVSDVEADRYWATRTPAARATGAASHQSRVISDLAVIESDAAELGRRYGENVPRPDRWGAYRIRPELVEFWQEGDDRLHDRRRYRRNGNEWAIERLAP